MVRTWRVGAMAVASLVVAAGVWAWVRSEPREAAEVRRALSVGRFAEADSRLGPWLKRSPGSAEAHLFKGRVDLALGNVPGAVEAMKRAGELGIPRPQLDLLGALIASKVGRHAE